MIAVYLLITIPNIKNKARAFAFVVTMTLSSMGYTQQVIELGGIKYEAVTWSDSGGLVPVPVEGSWSGNDGGSVRVNPEFFAGSFSSLTGFNDSLFSSLGISLTGVTFFRPNMGQHNNKETLLPEQQTISNTYTFNAISRPTEILFVYGGDNNNGFKYTVHDWRSPQPGTVFELVAGWQPDHT